MSRVGRKPVSIPSGVEVNLNGRELSVKGAKGQLDWTVPHEIAVNIAEQEITFEPKQTTKQAQAFWGLTRSMTANMVEGVTNGYELKLEIRGVGYRAAMQGNKLNLSVGYSHPVNMEVPQGLQVAVNDNTEIVVTGINKQMVGQFTANVRRVRPPEPYKGKGIRYADEHVIMKEGKKK